jgi:hypothetical protein
MKPLESTDKAPNSPAGCQPPGSILPLAVQTALLPVAMRVFWWGHPQAWLNDPSRLAAQVMTYGDWNDTVLTLELLGESCFKSVLKNPPAGVFDLKSWLYWHRHFHLDVAPLPSRRLP